MKILIVAIGSQGDVNPFIKIGLALQERAHDVTILSNDYFRDSIRRAGLDFSPVGSSEDFTKMVDKVDTGKPAKTVSAVMDYLYFNSMQETYDTIENLQIPGNTVILGITMAFGARIAREQLGIPLITCHLAPVSFPSVSRPAKYDGFWMPHWMPGVYKAVAWRLIDLLSDMGLARPINGFRKKLGLPGVSRIFRSWLHSPDRVMGLFPDWFAPRRPDWPAGSGLTGFVFFDESENRPIPKALETFIANGEPPVVFTAGTAVSGAAAFFRTSVRACEILNLRGVFLTQYRESVPKELAKNFHYCEYAPFSRLFPKAAAVVHHGGIGTCAQGLRAGIPQLVSPFGMDQPDNASRLVALGVGDTVRMNRYKSRVVAKKLDRLIRDNGVQARCKQIADKINRSDPLDEICRMIEAMVN